MTRVGSGSLDNMTDSYQEGQMISEEGEEMEVDQEQVEFWNSDEMTIWLKAIGLTNQRLCARLPHHESPNQEL